jgi:CxxC motif-containing protein
LKTAVRRFEKYFLNREYLDMKEFVCIVCPNSCKLTVDDDLKITGAKCKRGDDFAVKEMTSPVRSVTSTVRTVFAEMPLLPVKTASEVPKNKIFDVMRALAGVTVDKPLKTGDVVLTDVAGTGVNVVSTSSVIIDG